MIQPAESDLTTGRFLQEPSKVEPWRLAVDERTRRKVALRELRRDLDRRRRVAKARHHAERLSRGAVDAAPATAAAPRAGADAPAGARHTGGPRRPGPDDTRTCRQRTNREERG